MTPEQQHGLLVILGDVGLLPTTMNESHGIIAAKAAQLHGVSPAADAIGAEITKQNAIAEAANGKIGGTTGAFETLKAAILAIPTSGAPPVEPPPPPQPLPVPIGPGLVSPPLQPSETRRLIGAGDQINWIGTAGPGLTSVSLGSGSFPTYSAVVNTEPVPGVEPTWQAYGSGATNPRLSISPGQFLVWKFTGTASQEVRPQLQ